MAGRRAYFGPPDPRWEFVETSDLLGRPVERLRPRVGSQFGDLLVVGVDPAYHARDERVRLRCTCGQESDAEPRALRRGKVRCGKCGHANRRGKWKELFPCAEIRGIWLHRYTGMVSRCTDPGHRAYPNYGGRGIRVHPAWLRDRREFFLYAKTLEHWDVPGLDLDRIDNDGHYEPGNLRLVPRSCNTQNRRNAARVEFRGERLHLSEFHRRWCPTWKAVNTIRYHLDRGRTPEWIVDAHDRGARLRPAELRAPTQVRGRHGRRNRDCP